MDNKTFGYIRVSTKDQNTDRQFDTMRELGINERDIFVDVATGANFEREEYQMLLRMLRAGDLIYIDALDRLGRNYEQVIKEWKYITREKQADIVVLEQRDLFDSRKFKTMGDIGKLLEDQFLSMMAYVAEQERKRTLRRQREGINAAKARGKKFGRKEAPMTEEFLIAYKKWRAGEITAVQAMNECKVPKSTFYKLVKRKETVDNC